MKQARIMALFVAFLFSVVTMAQNTLYSGTVVDVTGEPVIGASVMEKGTSRGAVTDIDGNFNFKGNAGARLVISYIGYATQEVAGGQNLKITLKEDQKSLNEVVVVGYGVQKKSVVTASIAKVNTEDLEKAAPLRLDNALKGLASGVTVTSASGQPGAAARIRIRGVGTINNSDPLYIVDGMPIEGGLDMINPADIESMEVLKDAASGAIYGARAANGVVLVTTKSGKLGKARVNYNFSYGWQSKWKKRDILNATEYATMMNEGLVNAGRAPRYAAPYKYGTGTDWQDLVFNDNAPVMNHDVSVSGASDAVKYYLSAAYYTQDGIIGGNFGRSNYDRLTLRSNTSYTIFDASKERNWLNKLTATVNVSYGRTHSTSIEANSTYGSVLGSALALSPILTPTLNGKAALEHIRNMSAQYSQYVPMYTGRVDANGVKEVYTLPGSDYNEMGNPLAILSLPGEKWHSSKLVANFKGDLQIWDGLVYHINYSADQSWWGSDGYTPIYYIRQGYSSDKTVASSAKYESTVWQIENTVSYDKVFGDHTFNVVLGQSAKKYKGSYLSGSREDLISLERPYIDAATGQAKDGKMSVSGAPYDESRLASLFGRVSYNYAERYMAQFTVRRDGSSHFGSNNHYATFPSFSLGWNVTNEPYFKAPKWLTNTKVRFSWGKNGNENIGNFLYTVTAATGSNNNYILGRNESSATGSKASGLPNANLKWEESEQTDLGLDLGFFQNALTFTVDYYVKKTNGMLLQMPIPSYIGENKPWGNVGKMKNSGVEFEASYKWRIADANFRVSGNLSYLKNELIDYGNETGYANYDSYGTLGTITRAENGHPFPFFYGFKTAGIFQTVDEVNSYVNSKGELLQPHAQPGDVRMVDVNRNGVIDDNDQTDIGKGMPSWTYGLNFTFDWKGFDFSMMLQGVWGNKVFDATRRTDIESINLPTYMLGRWTGPGTSNKYPIFRLGDSSNDGLNLRSSDLFLFKGDYLRLKNLQVGYTLPQELTRKIRIERLRVFFAAENLLTFTKYPGLDPEISSGGTSLGVDYGVYPQARTLTVGVNLGF